MPQAAPKPAPSEEAVPRDELEAVVRDLRAGGVSRAHQALLEQMRRLDERMRYQRAIGEAVDKDMIRHYNELAEQASRAAQAFEDQLEKAALQRAATALARVQGDELALRIERLRTEQDQLRRQLRVLADQQRRLTETQIRLLEEADRIRTALREN